MFFSRILIVIFLGAIFVFPRSHALSPRAIEARVAAGQQAPATATVCASPPSSAPSSAPSSKITPSTRPIRVASSPTFQQSPTGAPGQNGPFFGDGTYFDPDLGACGMTNTAEESVCAVSHELFDSFPGYNGVNPNTNPICGKEIEATYQGKVAQITIVDRCGGCAGLNDLDMATGAFTHFAPTSVGRIHSLEWSYV